MRVTMTQGGFICPHCHVKVSDLDTHQSECPALDVSTPGKARNYLSRTIKTLQADDWDRVARALKTLLDQQ